MRTAAGSSTALSGRHGGVDEDEEAVGSSVRWRSTEEVGISAVA